MATSRLSPSDDQEFKPPFLLAIRSERYSHVDDEPLKTTVLVKDHALFTPNSKVKIARKVFDRVSQSIHTDRPVECVTARNPHTHSPWAVQTPGGTELKSRRRVGEWIYVFTNEKGLQVKPETTDRRQTTRDRKKREVRVTPALLEKTARDIRIHGGRRCCSQNQVMGGGATDYANSLPASHAVPPGLKWEWLHLVAHNVLGDASQASDNLVCGTAHANTNEMFIEGLMAEIADHTQGDLVLTVEAMMIEGTELAREIHYSLKTRSGELLFPTFVFDAQDPIKPHYCESLYVKALVRSILETDKENQLSGASPSPATPLKGVARRLLFTPSPQKAVRASDAASPSKRARLSSVTQRP